MNDLTFLSITDHQDIQVCFSESNTEYMKQGNDTISLIVYEERAEKAVGGVVLDSFHYSCD